MKRKRFNALFLLAAIIIFIALRRNIPSSIILMLASVNMLVDVIPELWKEVKDGRKS